MIIIFKNKQYFDGMELHLKKLTHRDVDRIGIFFDYDRETIEQLKKINAVYSKTHRCWLLDYNTENYAFLKSHYEITYEPKTNANAPITTVADDQHRVILPIAQYLDVSEPQLGKPKACNPEHKKEIPFAEKVKLQLLSNVGKYWVF